MVESYDELPAAVVLARLSSSRLQAKSLRHLAGQPMIERVLERLKACDCLGAIIVATSDDPTDDPLADHLQSIGVRYHRGSLHHVAQRAVDAAIAIGAERFFRVNADSPFVAVELFSAAGALAKQTDADLVSNIHPRELPPGASVELIKTHTLASCLGEMLPNDTEHVTAHLYRHADRFNIKHLACPGYSFSPDIRLVVDDREDMERAAQVLSMMNRPHWEYGIQDVLDLLSTLAQ